MSGNVIVSVQHIPFVILDQPRLWAFYTDKIHQTDSHKMSGKVLIIVSADLNVMECIILTAAYWLFYIIPSHLCLLDDSTRNLSKWLLPVLCLESGQRLLRIEDSLHAKRSGASATIASQLVAGKCIYRLSFHFFQTTIEFPDLCQQIQTRAFCRQTKRHLNVLPTPK